MKVNLQKSERLTVGEGGNIDRLVGLIGCKKGHLPARYLGHRLGAKFKPKGIWHRAEEKFLKRLVMWNMGYR